MKFCGFIRASSLEWKALLFLSLIASPAFAQQAAVSLSSGSSVPGGAVSLSISLASTGGAQPAAVQWTMGYSTSSVTSVSVIAGSSLTAAGKSVTCSPYATGTICVAYGMNTNTISDGILATATFQIAPGTLVTSVPVQMTAVSASTPPGVPIAGAGTGGTISITQPVSPAVSGLTCVPATVTAPGSAACTVTVSSPALSGGFSIALNSQNSAATVPSTVNVAAGASSATFTATVSSVSSSQTATISAVGGGATKTFNLSIVPGQWSISGAASALGSGATITLSGAKSATTTGRWFRQLYFYQYRKRHLHNHTKQNGIHLLPRKQIRNCEWYERDGSHLHRDSESDHLLNRAGRRRLARSIQCKNNHYLALLLNKIRKRATAGFHFCERCLPTEHHGSERVWRGTNVGSRSQNESAKWHCGDMARFGDLSSPQRVHHCKSVSKGGGVVGRHELYWNRHNGYQWFRGYWCDREQQRIVWRANSEVDYNPQQLLGVWSGQRLRRGNCQNAQRRSNRDPSIPGRRGERLLGPEPSCKHGECRHQRSPQRYRPNLGSLQPERR